MKPFKSFPAALCGIFLAVVAWSACGPADWHVWWMEMVWVLGVFAVLAATFRRFRFSNAAYGLVFIWLALHTVGAHYTFEHVPMDWLKELLGTTRNHYDRIAHFCIGLNSYMLAELYLRRRWVSGAVVAAVFGVVSIVAMAGVWEVIEWVWADWDGGDAGIAFLGSQGDVWDAQKDILCDTLGAIAAAIPFAILARRRFSASVFGV